MFYSYPRSEQPKTCPIGNFHLPTYFIAPVINAPVPCFYLSTILLQKESCGNEKKKEKSIGKNGQVSKILKQWVL
jgi:hypothetical protein